VTIKLLWKIFLSRPQNNMFLTHVRECGSPDILSFLHENLYLSRCNGR
jgi:hypothetical protein